MKVTPVSKKFGKYRPGDEFDLPDRAAKVFVRAGRLKKVESAPTYKTRMMTAAPPIRAEQPDPAPYGYKADGTPRKRPGRPAASE